MTAVPIQQVMDLPSGVRVRVWSGDGAETPALLVHGLSGTSWDWGRTVVNLPRAVGPLVAIDLPGFGGSAWRPAEEYSLTALARECRRTMEHLYPDRPFAFVGHSFGGKVGIILAATAQDAVGRLLLVDAGIEVGPAQTATRERFGKQPPLFPDLRAAVKFFQSAYGRESTDVTDLRMLDYLETTENGVRVRRDPSFLQAAFATPADEERAALTDAWRAISAPTKVIRGGASKMLTEPIVERMGDFGPALTATEIPGSGHNLPSECPIDLARELDWVWTEAP